MRNQPSPRSTGWVGGFVASRGAVTRRAIIVGAVIGGVVAFFLPWLWFYFANGLSDTSNSGPATSHDLRLVPLGLIAGAITGGVLARQQATEQLRRATEQQRLRTAKGVHPYTRSLGPPSGDADYDDELETSVGSFEVEPFFDPGYGRLWLELHKFKLRRGRQYLRTYRNQDVTHASDVTAMLRKARVPRDEAEKAALRVFGELVRWAHALHELNVIGVFPDEQPWPDRFELLNQWTAVRGDRLTRVSAGSLRDDASVGVVVVSTANADVPLPELTWPTSWLSIDSYPAPGRHGAVAITGAADGVVTLEARDGSEWVFDAPRRTLRMVPA